jgi:hypothetical protein
MRSFIKLKLLSQFTIESIKEFYSYFLSIFEVHPGIGFETTQFLVE